MQSRLSTRFYSALIVLGLAVCSISSQADTIRIFGSGQDNNGVYLPGGAIDPHYTITGTPAGPGSFAAVRVDAGGLPPGTIAEANSLSPDLQGTGFYTYTTTFDLTGFNLSTAVLNGTWGGDDAWGGVTLNGQAIAWTAGYPGPCCFFDGTFNATTGFLPGINTLSFTIDQTDNWFDYANIGGGTVTADPIGSPTPEPASLLLFGSAISALALRRRK